MDLFPDGGFVRLRSRARDKYVHADEDATSVSLRPLGAVASRNVAWEVKLWPIEGFTYLLLQGTAYSSYLAVSDEDEHAPSGHRGVRVVQRDSNLPHMDPLLMWLAVRVEAGQNYVLLHSAQGYLRANGRHSNWNNLVTVDVWNGSQTTMMQWRVEAIPSSPEALPLPPPPQPPFEGSCRCCRREGSGALCRPCTERVKGKLLAVAKTRINEECTQKNYYCLECQEIFSGRHSEHRERSIRLGRYKEQVVAWVTGEEQWQDIFEGIDTQDRAIRPYLLYKSEDQRCTICGDTISGDRLYGTLLNFCSLECFVAGSQEQERDVEEAIVGIDYSGGTIGFCLTCATAVMRQGGGKTHSGHDWVRVRSDSCGLKPRVVIPDGHPKKLVWSMIKRQDQAGKEVLIRDDSSVRCKECRARLQVRVTVVVYSVH